MWKRVVFDALNIFDKRAKGSGIKIELLPNKALANVLHRQIKGKFSKKTEI